MQASGANRHREPPSPSGSGKLVVLLGLAVFLMGVTAASIFYRVPALLHHRGDLRLGKKRTHRFGGGFKGLISRIHQTLGGDGIADFIDPPTLEHIIDFTL